VVSIGGGNRSNRKKQTTGLPQVYSFLFI